MIFPWNKYPYTDVHELNLTWVLEQINKLSEDMRNFIKFNTIKYADPLAWNITTQYEANTVVIDQNSGVAYLSIAPVPSGVAITDTDYWVDIFDLSPFFESIGDLQDLLTTNKDTLVGAINEVYNLIQSGLSDLKSYKTYTDAAADDTLENGDIFTTRGFYSQGAGAGIYRVSDTSANYKLALGNKYAELIPVNGAIEFDALGGAASYSDDAMTVALALAMHVRPPQNITNGYYRGGECIEFGAHAYNFADAITIPTDMITMKFKGHRQDTELLYQHGSGTFINIAAPTSDYNDNIVFEDLVFEGAGNMISLDLANNCKFDHCVFMNSAGNGLTLTRCVDIDVIDCIFLTGNGIGLVIDDNTTTVHIVRGGFRSGSTGLQVTNSNGIYITDTIIEYYSTRGFYCIDTANLVFENVWIEACQCEVTRCDVEFIGVSCHTYPDNTHSHIYIVPHTGEKHKIVAYNAPSDLMFATNPTLPFDNFDGIISYTDAGVVYDYTNRKIIIRNSVTVSLPTWVDSADGFVKFYGNQGTYFGNYHFIKANTCTISKIGGSLSDPEYISANDGIVYTSLTPTGMNVEFTL